MAKQNTPKSIKIKPSNSSNLQSYYNIINILEKMIIHSLKTEETD